MVDDAVQACARGLLGMAVGADDVPAAVVGVDLDSRVLLWNRGAERLYGWSAQEATGQSVRELMLKGHEDRADEVQVTTHAGGVWEGQFPAVRRDGTALVVWVSNAPVPDDTGRVVAVLGVSVDMTGHVAALVAREAQVETARADAQRLADRQSRLIAVTEQLGRALTPEQVVRVVLGQGVGALDADAGGIALVEHGHLRVMGHVG
jgi:PAS domain S-box-containing protein